MRIDIIGLRIEVKIPQQSRHDQSHIQIRQAVRELDKQMIPSLASSVDLLNSNAFSWPNGEWCPDLAIVRSKFRVLQPPLWKEILRALPVPR
jgi:hypothetical protein